MPRGIYGQNPHYEFRDRDPIFDRMRTIVKASGLKLSEIAAQCHLADSTLYHWFGNNKTISPRHDSVQVFYRSFGIEYGARSNLRVVVQGKKKRKAA